MKKFRNLLSFKHLASYLSPLASIFSFATLYLLLATDWAFAQTPEWVYQYINPENSEWPTTIVVDSSGNSYFTGLISMGITSGIGLISLDGSGTERWFYFDSSFEGGAGYDMAYVFNKLYLAGVTGNGKAVVLCVDTAGQESWRWVETLFSSEVYALVISSTQNAYAAGLKYPSPPDWLIVKLDSAGNEVWRYIYDGPAGSYDEAADIVIDRNENIYVGGYSTGFGTSTDFTVIKLDSAGNEKWVYRYDGPASYRDELIKIVLDTLGNIYMTGCSWGIEWDFCVVKIDTAGQEKWVYRYNGPTNSGDLVNDLALDDSGNVYVCGVTSYFDTFSLFTVIKIDSNGSERWCYLSAGFADKGGIADCITLDNLGGIYIGGGFNNFNYLPQISVVKLNPAGESLWIYIYPHQPIPWGDGCRDIVADVAGNIYLVGKICVSTWDDDIVVMKFASVQGVVEEASEKEKGQGNSQTSIFRKGFGFIASGNGYLHIYDVLRRVIIKEVVHKNQGVYIKLQPGVYFLRVEEEKNQLTKKIIVL